LLYYAVIHISRSDHCSRPSVRLSVSLSLYIFFSFLPPPRRICFNWH